MNSWPKLAFPSDRSPACAMKTSSPALRYYALRHTTHHTRVLGTLATAPTTTRRTLVERTRRDMRFTARVFALTALALFLALLLAPSVAALEETAQEAELEETVLEPTILDDSHHYVSAYDQAIANVDAEIAKHNHTEEGAAPEYERVRPFPSPPPPPPRASPPTRFFFRATVCNLRTGDRV